MKVYVITAGEYSDYHIVGVTLDKKFAKEFCKRHDDEWVEYHMETFDTDDIMCLPNGTHFWQVCLNDKGELWSLNCDDSITYSVRERNMVQKWETLWYVYVAAEDKEHAEKIGMDLITKHQYRKKVDEYAGE